MHPVIARRALCALAGALLPASVALAQEPQLAPPTLVEDVAAALPADLASDGEVTARLRVEIGPDGGVAQATLVSLEPEPAPEHRAQVEALALGAARGLRFTPATSGGAPVRVTIALDLTLSPAEPPRAATLAARTTTRAGEVAAAAQAAAAAPRAGGRTETRRRREEGASDLYIKVGALREVPRTSAEQLLTLAPGVSLSNHGGEGHPSAVFMRGFNAGEGQDIAFSVMGAPINDPSNPHGHGFADTHFLIPELVQAVRVVEGPFDPRQGDFAVAGSVDFELGAPQPGLTVLAAAGQFGTRRLGLLWGQGDADGGASWAGVEVRESEGFGPNRASGAARLLVGHEARLGERTRLKAWLGSYTGRFDAAGVVRGDDLDFNRISCGDVEPRFCTYDPNQGGQMGRHGGGVILTGGGEGTRWRHALHGAVRRVQTRENFTGFLTDRETGEAPSGDGIESLYGSWMLGASGAYVMERGWWGRRHEVEVGYSARVDSAEALQRRLREVGGQPYVAVSDQDVTVSNLGAHVATRLEATERLEVSAGGRVDTFGFGVRDRTRPTRDRQGERLGEDYTSAQGVAWSPRAGLRWALGAGLGLVAAWGRGVRSSEAAALSQGEFAPFARTQAVEAGLVGSWRAAGWATEARLVAFETYVDRDLVFDEVAGRNLFQGASNRFGALGLARVRRGERLDVMGSVSYTEAHLPGADDAWWQIWAGPRLPYIPRWVGRLDATGRERWQVGGEALELTAAAGLGWMAGRPLPFEQLGQAQWRLDAGLSARWGMVEVGLQVTNLLDQPYREAEFYYASNFTGPQAASSALPALHIVAGAPRTALLTLAIELGGGGDDDGGAGAGL